MYVDSRDQLLGNWTEITVSVWKQRQYDAPLAGRQASQGRERQPSVAARSIWVAMSYYIHESLELRYEWERSLCLGGVVDKTLVRKTGDKVQIPA